MSTNTTKERKQSKSDTNKSSKKEQDNKKDTGSKESGTKANGNSKKTKSVAQESETKKNTTKRDGKKPTKGTPEKGDKEPKERDSKKGETNASKTKEKEKEDKPKESKKPPPPAKSKVPSLPIGGNAAPSSGGGKGLGLRGLPPIKIPIAPEYEEPPPPPPDSSCLVAPKQQISNDRVPRISKRLASGYAETIGGRKTMEDKLVIFGDFLATARSPQNADYFAVFDGHNGDECAIYCASDLHVSLTKHLEGALAATSSTSSSSSSSASTRNVTNTIAQSFKSAFMECNQALEKGKKGGGTTAVVALFLEKDLWVANSGDSRAVLCRNRKAHRVTVDHKPHLPQERERIVRNGGAVMNGKVTGSLTVSRALGDTSYKPHVTCEPDVFGPFSFAESEYQMLILACDGLWDVVDDDEAVQIALECNDPHEAAVKLRETARQKLSRDNISVLVVFCPHFKPVLTNLKNSGTTSSDGNDSRKGSSNASKPVVTTATFSSSNPGKPSTTSSNPSPSKAPTTTTTSPSSGSNASTSATSSTKSPPTRLTMPVKPATTSTNNNTTTTTAPKPNSNPNANSNSTNSNSNANSNSKTHSNAANHRRTEPELEQEEASSEEEVVSSTTSEEGEEGEEEDEEEDGDEEEEDDDDEEEEDDDEEEEEEEEEEEDD